MMVQMPRVLVYDRLDNYLFDLDPALVRELPYTEQVNGEHSLTIVTTQVLEKTNRVLVRDGTGEWHEYVVLGIDDSHTASEYYCVWSLQYDLSATFINGPYDCGVVPGHASIPQLPRRALEVSLGDTTRWEIGAITVTTMSSASFYRRSGWEGLQTVVERWGGELHASIEVDSTGVVSRKVDLLAHEGTEEPTRRFDYGHDVTDIKRIVSDDVWPCRIVPLGKSQETEAGGYTRRPSIESVNGGILWIQDDEVAPLVRVRNPQGEWEYPTSIIKNDTYEQPADLLAWARENISDYTRPKVSYTATVAQFSAAGLNPHGVALGDEVIVVDRDFRSEGLRISARVIKIQGDLLDASRTKLTIGNATPTLGSQLGSLSRQVDGMEERIARTTDWEATASYVSNLISRLNTEINATGGYTYITEGEGIRTYDVPVSDPLVGAEASQVVEVKGGTFRIANSRTSSGDWDWKTVIVSGHVASELVTTANLVAGYIEDTTGESRWDLDSGTFELGKTLTLVSENTSVSFGPRSTASLISGIRLKADTSYYVAFSCAYPDLDKYFVVTHYYATTAGYLRVVENSDGSYRYSAFFVVKGDVVPGTDAVKISCFVGKTYPETTITVTDIKLYEIPNEGGRVIRAIAHNDVDSYEVDLRAEGLRAVNGGTYSELGVGRLLMNNSTTPAQGVVEPYAGVYIGYLIDEGMLGAFQDSNDYAGFFGPDGLQMAGISVSLSTPRLRLTSEATSYYNRPGPTQVTYNMSDVMALLNKWVSDSFMSASTAPTKTATTSDIITFNSSNTTNGAATMVTWGKVVMVHISYRLAIALTVPASGRVSGRTIGTLKVAPAFNTVGHGSYQTASDITDRYILTSSGSISLQTCLPSTSGTTIATTTTLGATFMFITS